MPDLNSLMIFLLATLALNLTPGPDMLYVIARSVGQGKRAGIVSALGIGAGTLAHMLAVAFGLATLLASVPVAYEAIRYAGAAYLFYLGVRTLLSKSDLATDGRLPDDTPARIFRQGMITNVLNPKVAFFFLAFLPQFADPSRGPVFWQIIVLGLLFDISGTTVNSIVALFSGHLAERLRARRAFNRAQRLFTGGVFVALALRLAIPERR